MSKKKPRVPQGKVQEDKLMIIKLRKYNEIRKLLIENRITGCRDTYAIGLETKGYL